MTSATIENPVTTETLEKSKNLPSLDQGKSKNQIKTNINRDDLHYYYSAGDFHFILEKGFKPETLENTQLTNVPFLPEWYSGILSIHGLIMPVIDILKFTKTQNLTQNTTSNKKNYLLKLEHADHKPIVLKLDAIPKAINTQELNSIKSIDGTPDWIKSYLENDSIKLAYVDHQKFFDQLIVE